MINSKKKIRKNNQSRLFRYPQAENAGWQFGTHLDMKNVTYPIESIRPLSISSPGMPFQDKLALG